jgi:hypothetical protein
MPLTCHTCRERRLIYIDTQILAGRPLLSIAKELGISYSSLRGHVAHQHHIHGEPLSRWAPVVEAAPVTSEAVWRDLLDLDAYDRLNAHMGDLIANPPPRRTPAVFFRWVDDLPQDERDWLQASVELDVEPVDLLISLKFDLPLADVVAHFAEGHHK